MRTVRITSAALLLSLSCSWVSLSLAQAPPSGSPPSGTGGIQLPSIPGLPPATGVPGQPRGQPPSGTGGTTGTGAQLAKGQDAQWMGKRCLNRGDNSLGNCQNVCKNLGVTRASDAAEYSGICNY